MHTVLVAELSRTLKSLVNGPMKEPQNRVVNWKDVDERTFGLFAEFLYTGGFNLSYEGNQAIGSGIDSLDSSTDKRDENSKKRKGSISNAGPELKRTKFWDLDYGSPTISTPPRTSAHSLRSLANKSPGQDSNANWLVHARLYVLADKEAQVPFPSEATCWLVQILSRWGSSLP